MNTTFRAMICGGGSVLAERFDFASADEARAWILQQFGNGVEYGTYRINLDDASWTRVAKPMTDNDWDMLASS